MFMHSKLSDSQNQRERLSLSRFTTQLKDTMLYYLRDTSHTLMSSATETNKNS